MSCNMDLIRKIDHCTKMFWGILSLYFPIKKKVVCFDSFGGQYNDNPKYVSEELHKQRPDITIVWNHTGKGNDPLPAYVKAVENSSYKGRLLFNSAQVVVDNHTGIRSGMCPSRNMLLNLYYRMKNVKRRGQLCISTFHGTPLKRIAMDEPDARKNFTFYSSADYVLSGCKYTSKHFKSAFDDSIEVREYGTPRNDILINNTIGEDELKRKLDLPLDYRIVLYAPTFRKNIDISGIFQMNELNIPDVIRSLSKVIGGERWCFVFRAHNLVMQKIDFTSMSKSNPDVLLINGNLHDDMAEYLKCADVLITDYSASMFDFALTHKPCFLYAPDVHEYGSSERGFYTRIQSLPFPTARNSKELILAIEHYNDVEYKIKIDNLLEDMGNIEDGNASKRVVKDILSFIDA